jgi:hypothetical protein
MLGIFKKIFKISFLIHWESHNGNVNLYSTCDERRETMTLKTGMEEPTVSEWGCSNEME